LPLRILFWNQEYVPSFGGVEIYTQNLAKALIKRGHSVAVVTGHSKDDLPEISEVEGVLVCRMAFFKALSSRDLAKIADVQAKVLALKRTFKPDLVHVNFTDASPFFHLRTRKQHDVSLIVLHEASDYFMRSAPLIRKLALRTDSIVAPSKFVADKFVNFLVGLESKMRIINNGVSEEFYLSVPDIGAGSMRRLLFAGRLVPEKGIGSLLEAVSILAARGSPIRLTIAGAGPDLAGLKDKALQLRIGGIVDFVGLLSRVVLAGAVANASAVVVPSIGPEPFGLIAAEAALAGRPVIAARNGALPEIVDDLRTGLMFEPGNALDMANAIERVVVSPDLAARLGAAARSRALERYTLSSMVDKYEHLYASLVRPDQDKP